MKGWLDNYGKEENPNDSKMSGPNIGITTKGRNYSPAWGGQFQNGGKPEPIDPRWFKQELRPQFGAFPIIDKPNEYVKVHGAGVWGNVPVTNKLTMTGGADMARVSYPGGSEFTKPNVNLGLRYRFEGGGSMPGSVGFTYAREGAPSNGKNAKKTLASAQDGLTTLNPRQKRGMGLELQEAKKEMRDKKELHTTGTIKRPQSIAFKDVAENLKKKQTFVSQDDRTAAERVKAAEAMQNVREGNIYGERPLLYLNDPTKILGDVGVPGYEGTEKDRERILMNRYNPNQHPSTAFRNQLNMGLEQVPGAALNLGLASMGIAEGGVAPTMGRIVGEALNPIPMPYNMGMKDTSDFWRNLNNRADLAGLMEDFNLKNFKTSVSPELRMGLQTQGISMPFNSVEKEVASIMDENKKWLSSEEGQRRLLNLGISPKTLKYPEIVYEGRTSGYMGGDINKIGIDLEEIEQLRNEGLPVDINSLVDHELAHWLQKHKAENTDDYMNMALGNPDRSPDVHKLDYDTNVDNFLRDKFVGGSEDDFYKRIKEDQLSTIPNDLRMHSAAHFTERQEPFAYTREFRRDLINKGYLKNVEDKATDEMVDKFMKDNRQNRIVSLLSASDPEVRKSFINTMNEIPAVVPGAIGVGAAATQMGGEEAPQYKQGGIIDDDMGQWAHPGEITRINSNEITMEDVGYPVIGVSDTGDIQYMEPDEDYTFEGDTVTEYPLAKNGKELTKLDQLTNFTNYNTKQPGGWLDNL